jgi:hypothetical protein
LEKAGKVEEEVMAALEVKQGLEHLVEQVVLGVQTIGVPSQVEQAVMVVMAVMAAAAAAVVEVCHTVCMHSARVVPI